LIVMNVVTTLPFVEILTTFGLLVVAGAGAAGNGILELFVDGVALPQSGASTAIVSVPPNSNTREIGAIQRTIALAPGAHTIALRWRVQSSGGTTTMTTVPGDEFHVSLRAQEVANAVLTTEP